MRSPFRQSLVACKSDEKHLDVTVSWDDTKQTIEGFGASSAFFGGNITDEVADQLFDAKKGIGLSLLRIMIGVPDDIQERWLRADGGRQADRHRTRADDRAAGHRAGSQGLGHGLDAAPDLEDDQQQERLRRRLHSRTRSSPSTTRTTPNYLADFVDLMSQEKVAARRPSRPSTSPTTPLPGTTPS